MTAGPPTKYTNDCGLGFVKEHKMLDNKIRVNTRDPAIPNYISKIGRDEQYYKLVEDKNNYEDMDFVRRYIEYYSNQQVKEQRRDQAMKKLETHILLSRKSKTFWDEYQDTLHKVQTQLKLSKGRVAAGAIRSHTE